MPAPTIRTSVLLACLLTWWLSACGEDSSGGNGSNPAETRSSTSTGADATNPVGSTGVDTSPGASASGVGTATDTASTDTASTDTASTDTATDNQVDPEGSTAEQTGTGTQTGTSSTVDSGFTRGKMRLPDYQLCEVVSDCYVNNGDCLTALPLNRAEQLPDGDLRTLIPIQQVPGFESVPEGFGVCSYSCTQSALACPGRFQIGKNSDPAPWTCQLAYAAASPYQRAGGLPIYPLPAADALAAGVPFAAICRPPFERTVTGAPDLCASCTTEPGHGCLPDSLCLSDHATGIDAEGRGRGRCVPPCSQQSDCRKGFTCRPMAGDEVALAGNPAGSYCVPSLGSCGDCLDRDGDSRGIGACSDGVSSAVDCNDLEARAFYSPSQMSHPFPEICGPDLDFNCNGLSDESEQVGVDKDGQDGLDYGAQHCGACYSTCVGTFGSGAAEAPARCLRGADGADRCRPECPTTSADCDGDPANGCETEVTDRTALFIPDCDSDGFGSPDSAPQFACPGAPPANIDGCAAVRVLPGDGDAPFGDDCNDNDPKTFPRAPEQCDGRDNDCSGYQEGDLSGGDIAELNLGTRCAPTETIFGLCADSAVLACGSSGEVVCQPGQAVEDESACDGVDEDCDGTIDDGKVSAGGLQVGDNCLATGVLGTCRSNGVHACKAGVIVCLPGLPQPLDMPGDGLDTNCDGFDGDLSRAVFVKPLGCVTQCDGTAGKPYSRLSDAFDLIAARAADPTKTPISQIYLASGTFESPHGLRFSEADADTSIVGGYAFHSASGSSPAYFEPASGTSTIVFGGSGTTICGRGQYPCPSADPTDFEAAISVVNPRNLLLRQLDITVEKPAPGFGHIVGLACRSRGAGESCSGLRLETVKISLAGGADGAPGEPGVAGTNGSSGTVGEYSFSQFSSNNRSIAISGGPGGASSCGAWGGWGGSGSAKSEYRAGYCGTSCGIFGCCAGTWVNANVALNGSTSDGSAGSAGADVSGGAGGGPFGSSMLEPSAVLRPSLDGGRGLPSRFIAAGGSGGVSPRPFETGKGSSGGWGGAGSGGGGGTGMSGKLRTPTWNEGYIYAAGGSGGASGGCGGGAGGGGGGGGSLIGLYWDDPNDVNQSGFSLSVGSGGSGGEGGEGGSGGEGGAQAVTAHVAGWGQVSGIGGPGGHGSAGGGGGGGGGGWSVAIARRSATVLSLPPLAGGAAGIGGVAGDSGTVSSIRPKHGFTDVTRKEAKDVPEPWKAVVAGPANNGGSGRGANECFLDRISAPSGGTIGCFSTCRPGYHSKDGVNCVSN